MTDYAPGTKLFSSKEHLRDVEALLPLVGTWARALVRPKATNKDPHVPDRGPGTSQESTTVYDPLDERRKAFMGRPAHHRRTLAWRNSAVPSATAAAVALRVRFLLSICRASGLWVQGLVYLATMNTESL